MKELLNTLYVMTQGAYLHLDHETLQVEVEGAKAFQVPLHHLGCITTFGNVMISPFAIARCAREGRNITLLDQNGRYMARIEGNTTGNVLLRRAQHHALDDHARVLALAQCMVAGKLQNARQLLLRASRDVKRPEAAETLRSGGDQLASFIERVPASETLDDLRGLEGMGARHYFEAFPAMITANREHFEFSKRTRRPPRDRLNALLSFLYALLQNDCAGALEGVGLDPQVGYLHCLRPGRPALALDLMEEFRPVLADRLAVTLVNRKQVAPEDFDLRPGDSVYLNEAGRKKVVVAYQERKKKEVSHPGLNEQVPLGLIPHLQARILARHLRGEGACYVPYTVR